MDHNLPLVSIIVPCFNYGALLPEALRSVLAQTYTQWECIIVDDGSTDDTAAKSFAFCGVDRRFKYIRQDNKGLAGARNTGLRCATGDYIQLLDADDILPERKLERHVSLLRGNPHVDLVYGTAHIFEGSLEALSTARAIVMAAPKSGSGVQVTETLLQDNMFLAHCPLFKTSLARDLGGFEETMVTCEDWNFWFRAAVRGAIFSFVDDEDTRVFARSHGQNMSRHRKNMWAGRLHFYELAHKILDDLPSQYPDKDYLTKQCAMRWLRMQSRLELTYGSMLQGLWLTVHALFRNAFNWHDLRDSMYWLRQRMQGRL